MNSLEAWSSGPIRIEVEGGYMPIEAAIELMRISQLVLVIGRAESKDPEFRGSFPIAMTAVEHYPTLSLARDPLAELGHRQTQSFIDQLRQLVQGHLEAARVAKEEFDKLAETSVPSESNDLALPSTDGKAGLDAPTIRVVDDRRQ